MYCIREKLSMSNVRVTTRPSPKACKSPKRKEKNTIRIMKTYAKEK